MGASFFATLYDLCSLREDISAILQTYGTALPDFGKPPLD